jgi:hypothetical protein
MDTYSLDSDILNTSASANVMTNNSKSEAVKSWTPVLTLGGGSVGVTYAIQIGAYQLVGRVVTVFFKLFLSSKGSSTGVLAISGLPFAPLGTALDAGTGSIGYAVNLTGVSNNLVARVYDVSTIRILQMSSNNTVDLTDANINNNTALYGSLSYLI